MSAHRGLHPRRDLPEGLRHRGARPRKFEITSLLGGASGFEVSKVEFSEKDVIRAISALHAEGNLRAAATRARRDARPAFARRSDGEARRAGDDAAGIARGRAHHSHRLRTAIHAAMVGEYVIEALAHMPTEVEFASEFRYRNMPMTKDTLVFASARAARRRTRWRRCARASARATARSGFATTWPAPSRARATAAFTCTPGRKSAWRRRNRSRRRSRS